MYNSVILLWLFSPDCTMLKIILHTNHTYHTTTYTTAHSTLHFHQNTPICHHLHYHLHPHIYYYTHYTDIVMESLVGHLAYSEMKASTDPHLQRRILIAKWIYIHGFLNIHFPPTRRYTPAHFEVEERKNAI